MKRIKRVSLTSNNYYQLLHQYLSSTSREQTSALEPALFKIAELKRQYEVSTQPDEYFYEEEEIKKLRQYIDKIGYQWEIVLKSANENIYEMMLSKNDKQYQINQLSSGETKLLNFLLGILSTGSGMR